MLQSPRRSTRRRSQSLGISRESLMNILNKQLKFHPYKIVIFKNFNRLTILSFFANNIPRRIISRYSDVSWPPRSPDISPCDFFVWGYVKSKVYVEIPRNIQELKDAKITKFWTIWCKKLWATSGIVLSSASPKRLAVYMKYFFTINNFSFFFIV